MSNSIQFNEKYNGEKHSCISESSASVSRKQKANYKHESSLNDDDEDGYTSPVSLIDNDNFILLEEEEMIKDNKGSVYF